MTSAINQIKNLQQPTTTKLDAASNNKRVAAENFEVKKGKKAKKNTRKK